MPLRAILILIVTTSGLMARADEPDFTRKPDAAFSRELCTAGVRASTSRRQRDVPDEIDACVKRVEPERANLNRISFARHTCELNFRGKPSQRRACYEKAIWLNAPSSTMAGILMECQQQRDDVMFGSCAHLEFLNLDRRLQESARKPARATREKRSSS